MVVNHDSRVATTGLENLYQEILSQRMAVPEGIFSCQDNNTITVALGASFAPIRVDYCQCQHSSCKNPSNVQGSFQQTKAGGRSGRTEKEKGKKCSDHLLACQLSWTLFCMEGRAVIRSLFHISSLNTIS